MLPFMGVVDGSTTSPSFLSFFLLRIQMGLIISAKRIQVICVRKRRSQRNKIKISLEIKHRRYIIQ
jgi:hypothetical protein